MSKTKPTLFALGTVICLMSSLSIKPASASAVANKYCADSTQHLCTVPCADTSPFTSYKVISDGNKVNHCVEQNGSTCYPYYERCGTRWAYLANGCLEGFKVPFPDPFPLNSSERNSCTPGATGFPGGGGGSW